MALLHTTTISAQTEGPNNSTNIFDGAGGQISDAWTNPNLARTQDDQYATIVTTTKNKRTNYLQVQKFGFAIPAGSSIDGILVEIERYATVAGGGVDDERIRIIDAMGNIDAGSDQSTGLTWPTSDTDTYQSYGGATDTWTITDWTPAKINNDNFGVAIQGKTSNDNTTFNLFIDHVRITIFYTSGGSQRYAVATGNWSDTNSWSTTAGGAPGASVPSVSDDVFIGGGFTITQDVNGADCNSLTIGTSEATPTGTLTFDNNNRDIDIGDGGFVITADGDVISAFTPRLTTTGDFTLNAVLTNRDFEVRMDTNDGLIISGTGTMGYLNVRSFSTHTGTITVTTELAGTAGRLINGATAHLTYSGTTGDMDGDVLDVSTVGNTVEFSQTLADAPDFNVQKPSNTYYNLIISGNAPKFYNGDITVNGDLTITATGILDNSSNDGITLFGNWTNNNGAGGFLQGTGNGSEVIFMGTNNQTITNAAGEGFHRFEVDKTAGTVSAVNDISIADRMLMTAGTLDVGSNSMDGAGDFTMDAGEVIIGTTGVTVPEMTGTYALNAGTISFDGAGAQTIRSTTSTPAISAYVDVNFNGSGSKTLSGAISVDGNLGIGGTADLDVSGSDFGITLMGNWTSTSTFNEQNGTVTLNGSAGQTITNASGETFYNLTINNTTASNAVTLGGNVSLTNTITFTDGHIVSSSSNLLSLGASSSVASVSDNSHVVGLVEKITTSTSLFSFPTGDGTNYMAAGITPTATSSTTFQAEYFNSEQTEGTALGAGVDHISSQDYWTVDRTAGSANAAVTLGWEYAANPEVDNLPELLVSQWDASQWTDQGNSGTTGDVNAGTVTSNTISNFTEKFFVLGSSTTNNPLSINRYFIAASANWDDAGVWSYRSGGPGGAPEPTATKNVIIEAGNVATILDNSAGQATVSMLSLNVLGTLTMANNAGRNVNAIVGTGGFSTGAAADITGADDDNITVSGDITLSNSSTLSHSLLEVNFGSQNNLISGTGSLPFLNVNQANQVFNGDVSFGVLTIGSASSNDGTITVTGTFDGGGTITNNSTGTIDWQGTVINGTPLDATTPGNTLRIENTTGGNIDVDDFATANTVANLIIAGTDEVIISANYTIDGDLTIEAGAILDNANNNRKINISGNWINNNGAGGFLEGTNDITFDGTAAQTLFISSGDEVFEDMIMDNSSSTGLTLTQGEVHITNSLTLTDGIILTDATNCIVIEDNATADEGSAASFVDGPIKKVGNDAFVFPTGDGSTWARISMESIANFGTDTEFTAEYFNSAYSNTMDLDTDLTNVSTLEHWTLDRSFDVGDDASCDVRIYWESATDSDIEDLADLRVGHFYNPGTGLKWYNFGGTTTDNGDDSGDIISTTTFTEFSPITFASAFGFNPLPIELLHFEGKIRDNNVVLEWSTASEINNDYFTIQRSLDGLEFESLGFVDGAGNSNKMLSYTHTDQNPYTGLSYYRLKQTDFDGTFSYSDIIVAHLQSDQSDQNPKMVIYPNPLKNEDLKIRLSNLDFTSPRTITINITDLRGANIYSKSEILTSPNLHINRSELTLDTGIYIVNIKTTDGVVSSRLLVK